MPGVNGTTNGSTAYGEVAIEKIVEDEHKPTAPAQTSEDDMQLVLQSFRLLIADLCQQFGMGHPGGAIGMAAIGVALWKYAMRYASQQPDWFNRDRFVLSNGHTCLFQYTNLYLSGYKAMTWEQLLSYHSERPDSLCPGHPEIEHEGIELTTGPLGQGIANAVGLAMATKHLAATFNRPGYDVVDNHTWCTIGDACMQEGVGCEAFSYAGHLELGNLTVIYDNNQISCDGSVDLTNTEDVNRKMEACGWEVINIEDGNNDVAGIVAAMEKGRDKTRERPLFINVRTIIGMGSAVAGQAVSHGAPLGADNVAAMKKAWGWDPEKHFHIPDTVKKFYADIPQRGDQHVQKWTDLVAAYTKAHPDLAQTFKDRMAGKLPDNWQSMIPTSFPTDPTPTRKSNNLAMAELFAKAPTFMIGTADLTPSVNLTHPNYQTFNPPSLIPTSGPRGSYSGRYIHYGIREHLMCAIANGLAAYSPFTILPVTSTFAMFYLYAAPAVRMGALQRLPAIHIATHDSIGAGEDGPTHQPVELAALFRAMPHLTHIRPADSEEAAGAWLVAVANRHGPSMISVSRHALPQLSGLTKRADVAKGAYVLRDAPDARITLISAGAELHLALSVADILISRGTSARVVSFPSHALFRAQPLAYQRSVLRRHEGVPAVVVEPYVALGWERWADAGVHMSGFGHSLPGKYVYKHFGFDAEGMAGRVGDFLESWGRGEVGRGEYVEL
ncbi:Transketolase, thiamine diphosphate binding domain-containing protein [Boeremia exigua]|uniref:Transketolase, thiamine diphosphate binding domain-containing protein n=1 Tax=Boeremia exigua TaxID=749465 RepID=UPI001E8DBC00|nr:Transketolase, thiamine diphosphate binding domain-containing protein [Boeremia exigua]KAH6612085.1 Transketolase, thiamine diphosphate binding domain-containing protein [Boeremia exigua]